jgi:hypothetical protein
MNTYHEKRVSPSKKACSCMICQKPVRKGERINITPKEITHSGKIEIVCLKCEPEREKK